MGGFKFGLVIAAVIGYVSAKGYNIGSRPTANVPEQPRTGPGNGGGMRPGYGGMMQPNIGGGNPGELKQSKIGGGLPSNPGGNYGRPIAQMPVGVSSPIGSNVPSNVGGRPGNGGGMRPGNGGNKQPNFGGGNPGEPKQSKIGGGLPSNPGGNYGQPIAQMPVGVGSPIGSNVPSNIGGGTGGRPGNGNNGRQVRKPEETNYPPRPFNMDCNIQDEQGNVQYRQEEGDGNGNVRGTYGYKNIQGLYRNVQYEANANGFKAVVDTNEPGTDGKENPADVIMNVQQPPAGIQDQYNTGRNGGQNKNYGPGDAQTGSIGGPAVQRRPMPGMKPNKGSPDFPAGVNPGRQNSYNNPGAGVGPGPGRNGNPGTSQQTIGPMSGMKPNKGSPELPAGVNPGGPQNYGQHYEQRAI